MLMPKRTKYKKQMKGRNRGEAQVVLQSLLVKLVLKLLKLDVLIHAKLRLQGLLIHDMLSVKQKHGFEYSLINH